MHLWPIVVVVRQQAVDSMLCEDNQMITDAAHSPRTYAPRWLLVAGGCLFGRMVCSVQLDLSIILHALRACLLARQGDHPRLESHGIPIALLTASRL